MDRTSRRRSAGIAVIAALLVTAACSGSDARKDDANRRTEAETEPERDG